MYDLPPGVVFGPTDPEIVLYYLLNRVNGKPMFEDSMNYITECDVYGDPNAWIKVFQETHMERLYFYAKLKKKTQKGKRIERSTHCGTWRCQKDEQLFLNETQYGSKRSFTFVAKNGFNGMGRWTMHEFRLDGLYGNTANQFWEEDSVFYVNGYRSESSGKLCMVGSGKNYSKVVLKLNYSKNNTIYGSLIDGTLESLHMESDDNYFEPIVIMGLSQNPIVYELEYWSDCGSVNCNPLLGSIGHLPNWIAFRGVRCDQHSRKVQILMGFPNPSTGMKFEFPGPNATLIAEGAWDEKDNQFCSVACRILADASVGDCSIGFSLRFPAVLSLRNVGEIWSKKDVIDSDCFGRIGFQSWERPSDPQGLRYEYTEIEEVRNSCALGEETIRGKGKSYADG
nr:nac domain-containing protein 7 [Quercus suber]